MNIYQMHVGFKQCNRNDILEQFVLINDMVSDAFKVNYFYYRFEFLILLVQNL